ncbi:hypothetical protein D3C78_1348890 [compost metagenome]
MIASTVALSRGISVAVSGSSCGTGPWLPGIWSSSTASGVWPGSTLRCVMSSRDSGATVVSSGALRQRLGGVRRSLKSGVTGMLLQRRAARAAFRRAVLALWPSTPGSLANGLKARPPSVTAAPFSAAMSRTQASASLPSSGFRQLKPGIRLENNRCK